MVDAPYFHPHFLPQFLLLRQWRSWAKRFVEVLSRETKNGLGGGGAGACFQGKIFDLGNSESQFSAF